MKRVWGVVVYAVVTCLFIGAQASTRTPEGNKVTELTLWYRQPAKQWVEALPVGNGRLGGMMFGGAPQERIQLNEDSLWSGAPQDADNPEALKALPEIRRLLFEGKYVEAQNLTYQKLVYKGKGSGHAGGAKLPYGSYETLGDLKLTFEGHDSFTEYRRELDLDIAGARAIALEMPPTRGKFFPVTPTKCWLCD